jgi:hypothetical protein
VFWTTLIGRDDDALGAPPQGITGKRNESPKNTNRFVSLAERAAAGEALRYRGAAATMGF